MVPVEPVQKPCTRPVRDHETVLESVAKTNRLLVGPFKTDKEARDLVNGLAKLEVGSYPWKSEDGQKVEKVAAR